MEEIASRINFNSIKVRLKQYAPSLPGASEQISIP